MLGLKDTLAVADALAPLVREGVGEADCVLLADSVLLGVTALVPVPEGVGLPVPDEVGVAGGVAEPDWLVEGVIEALAPVVKEGVGEADCVLLALSVLEGVGAGVPVPLAEGEAVSEGVAVSLPVALALPPVDSEGVELALALGLRVSVLLPVGLWEGVGEGEPEGVALGLPPREAVGVGLAVTVEVALALALAVAAALPAAVALAVAAWEGASGSVGEAAALPEAEAEEVGAALLPLAHGEGEALVEEVLEVLGQEEAVRLGGCEGGGAALAVPGAGESLGRGEGEVAGSDWVTGPWGSWWRALRLPRRLWPWVSAPRRVSPQAPPLPPPRPLPPLRAWPVSHPW
jgi:hypothetical protein